MALAMPASRSLIALLVGTVAFFALWMFALKGGSGNGTGSPKGGLGAYQSDINAAHNAVATSNASNAASGNDSATSSSGGASASKSTPSSSQSKASATSRKSPTGHPALSRTQQRSAAVTLSTVQAAVSSHKAVALLFYNPAAADDLAVKQELASVSVHKGRVVKLAIPLSEAASFTAVTQQVPLNFSPTLVLISTSDQASEIVGYADPFEINQRVDDALASS